MAKLSAHGQELVRITKDLPLSDCTCVQVQTLMSDGTILYKDTYRRSDGTSHSDGWKKNGKTSLSPEAWFEMKRRMAWRKI